MESNPQSSTEMPVPDPVKAEAVATATTPAEAAPRVVEEYAVVPATVVRLTATTAVVSFGWKCEGQVPFADFEKVDGKPAVKVGDAFDVLVESLGDQVEQSVLSKEKADKLRTWESVARCGKGGQLPGTVVARCPGGYYVDIGMRAFLPSSQADVRRMGDPDSLVGETLTFGISEFDKRRGNIVLSRRMVLEKEQKARKQETLAKLAEGVDLPGVVRSLTDYGAFVDIGGLDGLLHVSEMSWGRVGHPREVLEVGQELTVRVLKYDAATGKVGLGLKQLQEDPWATAAQKYPPGTHVAGRVVGFAEFGAFLALEKGLEGLVHVSEISWKRVKHPSHELRLGQEVKAVVLEVDARTRRIGLSMRQLEPNPWESLQGKYPVGTVLRRRVRGVTEFGVFLGLEDGIDGLVHISELSWEGNVKHPGDLYKAGDEVEAVVLDVDVENERLSLSIKQCKADPWLALAQSHPVGSKLKGKVTRLADFGAFVALSPGVEGLVHISELSTERVESVASAVKVGQELEVQVLDINARDRKVSLSVRALSEAHVEDYRDHLNQDGGRVSLGEVFGDKLRKK